MVPLNSQQGATLKFESFGTPGNLGYAGACNVGASEATGEFLVFTNDDMCVEPNWISELVRAVRGHDACLATPKILLKESPKVINAAGGECDLLGFAWNRGNGEFDDGKFDDPGFTFYGSACLMIRHRTWSELGGFDEKYFMYHEDVDLCWRAAIAGVPVLYVPNAIVYHSWHGPKANVSFVASQIARNSFRTVLKNYELRSAICLLPAHLIVRLAETAYFLRTNRPLGIELMRGLRWNVINLRDTFRKRQLVQATRKVRDRELRARMVRGSLEIAAFMRKSNNPAIPILLRDSMKSGVHRTND